MSLFPSLKFLDFELWPMKYGVSYYNLKNEAICLAAISGKKEACPSLKGLQVENIRTDVQFQALLSFNRPLQFLNVKIFSSSITTGPDCSSELVQRCTRIFPNLTLFQHAIKDEDKFHGCKYHCRNGVLVEVQQTKNYAEELILATWTMI